MDQREWTERLDKAKSSFRGAWVGEGKVSGWVRLGGCVMACGIQEGEKGVHRVRLVESTNGVCMLYVHPILLAAVTSAAAAATTVAGDGVVATV